MFVPVIPIVPNTTVVNKTIVYSDTVLPIKDLGGNLKVTSISNVDEYSLEKCLKIIFESNPNVIFNTIQYSREDKKVYFYSNDEISKKAWEDSKIRTYKPITKSSEILEEVKNILVCEPNKNTDCISLYDIAQLLKIKSNEYKSDKHSFEKHFDYVIESRYGSSSSIVVYDFDYDKDELRIGFKYWENYDKIIFAKKDEDLYVKESESSRGKDILVALGDSLSKLYDKFIQYRDIKQQNSYRIKPVNSNFLVDVSYYGVDIFVNGGEFRIIKEFELSSHSYETGYDYDCNSSTVINALKGNEDELFKRIFVMIDDCPEWMQEQLYEIRQNQLVEQQKMGKRLKLKMKIFPFLKK